MAARQKTKPRERIGPVVGGVGLFSLHGRVWWLALFLGIFPIAFRQVSVSDAWWHVALGRWLVEKQSLPDLAQFYFSPFDAGWLASELRWEWLGDVVLYLCYAAAGAAGLQWLVIGCVMAGLEFLSMLGPKSHGLVARVTGRIDSQRGPWLLLLLVAVSLGTYQLQLARNSVFSLALYPAVLWLGLRRCGPPTWREYAAIGGVLVLWSFLHGSCVLGWATAFVIFGARAASAFRGCGTIQPQRAEENSPGDVRKANGFPLRPGAIALALFFAAFSISLALIVAGRNGAVDFLLLPVRHVMSSSAAAAPTQPATSAIPAAPTVSAPTGHSTGLKEIENPGAFGETGAVRSVASPRTTQRSSLQQKAEASFGGPNPGGWKQWLNSSIWKPDPRTPWSNDYWSPFDMLPGMRPIEAAFALAIIAAVVMACFRNVPFGFVLAWFGAVFLGSGYVRMFGYTALASGAAIVVCTRNSKSNRLMNRLGWAAVGLWIAFSWRAFFNAKIETLIPEGQHVSRFGQVPIFDDATADWVKAAFPEEKVFTTIESGSYCLLRWKFQKPVFLDGFFAPHTREVWDSYHSAFNSGDLSVLHKRFGITVAIIPMTSGPWVERFLHSPDWWPAAIGPGSVVFLHKTIPVQGRLPQVFFTADDLRKTSAYFRYHALRNAFLVTAADKPSGFTSEQWISEPSFSGFRELAKEVFPVMKGE